MILNTLNDKMPSIRKNMVFFIFVLLIMVTPFFSGEWNNWVNSFVLILTCLLVGYVFFLYPGRKVLSFDKKLFFNPTTYLFIFLVVVTVSSFFSINRYKSFSQLILLLAYFLIYISAYKYFWNWDKIKKIVQVIFYVGGIVSIIAIIMFMYQSSDRATGLLYNANALGSYLLFSLLIGLVFLFNKNKKKIETILIIITLILIIIAYLLTYSYTSWVSFVLPFIIYIIYFRKKIFTKKVISIFLIVMVVFVGSLILLRYQNSKDMTSAIKVYENISGEHFSFSYEQRNNYNLANLEIFVDNPFIGTGYNTFQSVYGRYYKSINEQPRYAHNYYLQTLSETGLAGLLSFMVFIILTLLYSGRLYKKEVDEGKKYLWLAIFLGLLGSSIHSLFDFGWQFPSVFIIFWIFAGITNVNYKNYNEHHITDMEVISKNNNKRILIKVILTLVITILFIRGFTLLIANYYYQQADINMLNDDYEIQADNLYQGYRFDPDPSKLVEYVNLQIKNPNLTVEEYMVLEGKMKKLIKINDEDYFAHWALGNVYFVQEKNDLAILEYQKTIELNPVFRPDFYYSLAITYYADNDFAMVKKTINSILDKYPDGVYSSNPNLQTQLAQLYLLLGQTYYDEGNIEKAKEYYTKSLEKKPDFIFVQNKLKELE